MKQLQSNAPANNVKTKDEVPVTPLEVQTYLPLRSHDTGRTEYVAPVSDKIYIAMYGGCDLMGQMLREPSDDYCWVLWSLAGYRHCDLIGREYTLVKRLYSGIFGLWWTYTRACENLALVTRRPLNIWSAWDLVGVGLSMLLFILFGVHAISKTI